ncbi:MAG: RNA polymerase sigma factor [bacterium]|nr:RNA polymerase sigma factor [bacterium]
MTERSQDPDREVLARVAEGDVESFGVLVQRHEKRIHHLCERMLHNPEEARDAAQEVFLKAFRKAGSYRPRGKVYTWIYRIGVNHCLNLLRRRRIARFLSFGELGGAASAEDEGLEYDPPDEGPDAARRLEDRRRWQAMRRQIEGLPAGQRAVLVLAKFEGLSYRQIAEVLEITEGAVESRLFRAMQRLRETQETERPSVARLGERDE